MNIITSLLNSSFARRKKTNMKTKKFARIEAKYVRKNVRRPRGRKTTAELDLGDQNKWNMSETRDEWRKKTGRGDFFQNGTGMGLQTRSWWHETPIGSFFRSCAPHLVDFLPVSLSLSLNSLLFSSHFHRIGLLQMHIPHSPSPVAFAFAFGHLTYSVSSFRFASLILPRHVAVSYIRRLSHLHAFFPILRSS